MNRTAKRKPRAMARIAPVLAVLAAAGFLWAAGGGHLASLTRASEGAAVVPAPALDITAEPGASPAVAVLAGGCFWGVQGVFQHVEGVTGAVSGYSGGDAETAHYEMVGSGRTGHAESVRITFDPQKISYGEILQIFFSVVMDPTQLNRQGPDVGPQYRSAIFTANADQARIAKAYIAQLDEAGVYGAPIVTQVAPLEGFYPAEAYHQDFMTRHPGHPYIVFHDLPKLENLKRLFADAYRPKPVLVQAAKAAR